ncbi:MAG: chromosome segregation protein SMC [Clostridia bacterium]|nr:chromosome segregation protein SMC [Clostridia bacterium]
MYFKKIEMQGFKSFAEKTVIEFGDGITAVVGPNGSGKSNISDAVRWVLGEQSSKDLRGGRMEDMIFSGTDRRKPVSFAEVSITVDNSDHTLNTPYEEVVVTRRLFRSGESDYRINGTRSRLKDIFLLFADSGIGRESYSIIGQGKVDAILSSKSEDRRKIFEEASGIATHRIRMHDYDLNLAKAEQNLVVINATVTELEKQINTLKKQAESAEQFLKLKNELTDIEVGFLVHAVMESDRELAEVNKKLDAVNDEILDNEREAELARASNERLNRLSENLEEAYNEAREGAYKEARTIAETEAEIKVNIQHIESLKNEIARMKAENIEKGRLTETNSKRIAELTSEMKTMETELRKLSADIDKAQRRLNIVVTAISGDSATSSELNRKIIDEKLAVERLKSGNNMLSRQNEIYGMRVKEITEEIETRRLELKEDKESFDGLNAKVSDADSGLEKLNKKLTAANESKNAAQAEIDEKNGIIAELKTDIDSCSAQLKLLREMEENFEGYAKSVKEILTLCRNNEEFGKGIYGAVAQVITVNAEDEAAVSVALGNNFQDIITEDEESAKQAIRYLKANNLGRATFQPLSAVNARYIDGETDAKLKRVRGFVGIASTIVKYEPIYESVVGSLLGRVAVFEDIDSAIAAAKQFKYSFICVSRDGDILRPSGSITGGSPEKNRRGSTLSRTREIPEYEKKLKDGEKKHAALVESVRVLENTVKDENLTISVLTQEIRKSEVMVAALKADLAAKKRVFDENEEREKRLFKEIDDKKLLIESGREKIELQNAEIEKLVKDIASITASLEKIEESAKELNGEKERIQNEITDLMVKQSDRSNGKARTEDEIRRLGKEIELGAEYAETVEIRSKEADEAQKTILAQNEKLAKELEVSKANKDSLEKECAENEEKRRQNSLRIRETITKISEISARMSTLREESARLETRQMHHQHDIEYNKGRLFDEYEMTFTDAFKLTGGAAPEDPARAKARIAELRNGIKKLGNVNVASIEDLRETNEEYQFKSEQKKDCEDSIAKLNKLRDSLNDVMEKQFREQFALIRENFRYVFAELFGGGTADVVLEDESRCLDCGIDIIAKPPGKRLSNILLLSGGERAFTAIALLFAILRMKPTPFCILDEVESALDDSNVYRFASYTKGLSDETQFILITHRKGTMEAADALYGVTMEEKGVSKVVSVKMTDKDKKK